MSSIKIRLIEALTMDGGHIEPGEIVELSELSAKAAVNEGKAEYLDTETESEEQDQEQQTTDPSDDELEKLRKAIDAKYKRDDLAAAAKELGVEFPFDAKKADIVAAAIEAGKGAVLLQ